MLSTTLTARALLFGQNIEPRRITLMPVLSRDPTTIALEDGAYVVLFRFGAAVFFNASPQAEEAFLQQLQPAMTNTATTQSTETLEVTVYENTEERFEDGRLMVPDAGIPRLQIIADVLAKSIFLDDYEARAAGAFERIEPLADRMQAMGRLPRQSRELLGDIGEMLQLQHRLIARAQVGEKPDLLWDHPELERLWHRLENEYEIGERQLALERKLELIGTTAETLLGLLQDRRTLRVEWYIVILILVEIVLTLYELFFRHAA